VSLLPKTALRSTLRSLNSAIPLADLAFAGERVWQMQSYFRDLLSIEEARTILRCRLEDARLISSIWRGTQFMGTPAVCISPSSA
jgi:hypothetical protein